MRVAGIIAECNPLHKGHRYLIKEARDKTCAEYIVVALSGDYVQRGAGSLTPQIPERRLQPYFFGQIQIPYFS